MFPFNESYEILSYFTRKWDAIKGVLGIIVLLVIDHPTLILLSATHGTILIVFVDP